MRGKDGTLHAIPPLIQEKLAVFEDLEPAFLKSFAYVEQMHGQQRFPSIPVAATARYLHALWVCDCKDALLSIPLTIPRYDRRRALDLMLHWQEGATAEVVAFLEEKLDMVPFAMLTRQLQEAEATGDAALVRRLRHGRAVLLNRGINLHQALDAIFSLPHERLLTEARAACATLGHTPDAIAHQRALFDTPPYSYVPHAELARRTMIVMNRLGVAITADWPDQPGERTARVSPPQPPLPPYAENPIPGEREVIPPPYAPTQTPPPANPPGR